MNFKCRGSTAVVLLVIHEAFLSVLTEAHGKGGGGLYAGTALLTYCSSAF